MFVLPRHTACVSYKKATNHADMAACIRFLFVSDVNSATAAVRASVVHVVQGGVSRSKLGEPTVLSEPPLAVTITIEEPQRCRNDSRTGQEWIDVSNY